MNTREKERQAGYYIIEAAMFLPLVLLAVFTIGFLINVAGIRGQAVHDSIDEAQDLAIRTYTLPTDIGFDYLLEERVEEESPDIREARVHDFWYRYDDLGQQDVICFDLTVYMDLPLPFSLGRDIRVETGVKCRAWTGQPLEDDPFGFDRMEESEEGHLVYVFPASGSRYHTADCPFVCNEPRECVLTGTVRDTYQPCSSCDPASLPNGSIVYCYEPAGEVYHRGACRYVDKYVITMEKDEAEKRGYSPCGTCGGI